MAEPFFADVVSELSNRVRGVAAAAADVLSDAAAKSESGGYDAKEAVATAANVVALWVAACSELLALPRELLTPDTGAMKPITQVFDLATRVGVTPSLAWDPPLRNGFNVEMPASAVKLLQAKPTETTEFTIVVTPPLVLTGVFRGTVCATWPSSTATERFDAVIQVP